MRSLQPQAGLRQREMLYRLTCISCGCPLLTATADAALKGELLEYLQRRHAERSPHCPMLLLSAEPAPTHGKATLPA